MEKILFISPSTLCKRYFIGTIIVCIFPTLIFGWLFYHSLANDISSETIFKGCMLTIWLGISIAGFICTPYKYILTNSEFIIKRYFKDIVIPLQNIKLIKLMTKDERKIKFGVTADACFGSWGYIETSKYKKLYLYVRRWNNWTLIITDRKKYVIAPDDLQLIDAVTQQIGNTDADVSAMDAPVKQWRRWIPAAIVLPVFLLVFLSYKEPRVGFESDAFKLKGIYGVNIPFAEIAETDTITWREMPAISIRTNGISLFKVHRGNFRTTKGEKIRLSVNSGSSPIIRIVDRNGTEYYINRKNAIETQQIFNKLQMR